MLISCSWRSFSLFNTSHQYEGWLLCTFLAWPLSVWLIFRCYLTQLDCLDYGSNLSDHLSLSCTLSVDLSSSSPPLSFSTKNHRKAATIDHIAQFYSLIPCGTWWPFITLDDFCTRLTDCCNDLDLFSLPTIPTWVEFECTSAQGDNIISESNLAIPLNVCYKRSAKSRYKYEVRWLLHHKQFIRHAMMAAAIASSDPKMVHLVLIIFHNFSLHYTTFWTHKIIMVVTHCMFTSLFASLKAADLNDLIVSSLNLKNVLIVLLLTWNVVNLIVPQLCQISWSMLCQPYIGL